MSYMEFTGKTVKDAIAKACEDLNVEEALLEIEVVEESARGFLGLVGHRNARVRVRKREVLKQVMEILPSEFKDTMPVPLIESESTKPPLKQPLAPSMEQADSSLVDEQDPEKLKIASQAKELLEGILVRIPVEATVAGSFSNGSIKLEIDGDKSGLLIGKRGQTLDALQYIINKAVNRETPLEDKIEVIVDTEDYRQRKYENLREMALRMSQKAKKSLKPVALNPMPANERRIIHLILAEDREVYTKSYGEGPLRRIIVYPRKAMANKRRRR